MREHTQINTQAFQVIRYFLSGLRLSLSAIGSDMTLRGTLGAAMTETPKPAVTTGKSLAACRHGAIPLPVILNPTLHQERGGPTFPNR